MKPIVLTQDMTLLPLIERPKGAEEDQILKMLKGGEKSGNRVVLVTANKGSAWRAKAHWPIAIPSAAGDGCPTGTTKSGAQEAARS
jgi:hypothetical protein